MVHDILKFNRLKTMPDRAQVEPPGVGETFWDTMRHYFHTLAAIAEEVFGLLNSEYQHAIPSAAAPSVTLPYHANKSPSGE